MIDEHFQQVLNSLKADLIIYKESIREVSKDIITEGFSKYPVFIAHQHEVKIGEVILDKDELSMTWTINATTLEELIKNKVIASDKEDDFRNTFKDPEEFICILLLTAERSGFIFIPYTTDPDPKNN